MHLSSPDVDARARWASRLRRAAILAVIAVAWEAYARWLANPLVVPAASSVLRALAAGIASGELPARVAASLRVLVAGFAIGAVLGSSRRSRPRRAWGPRSSSSSPRR